MWQIISMMQSIHILFWMQTIFCWTAQVQRLVILFQKMYTCHRQNRLCFNSSQRDETTVKISESNSIDISLEITMELASMHVVIKHVDQKCLRTHHVFLSLINTLAKYKATTRYIWLEGKVSTFWKVICFNAFVH